MSSKEVIVSLAIGDETVQIGKLWAHTTRGNARVSFEYTRSWLNHPEKFALEPVLRLTEGVFHTKFAAGLFGAIGDSAPDRWGRILMRRAQIAKAKMDNVTPHTLTEVDYLLGVDDRARQGALRFSVSPDDARPKASVIDRDGSLAIAKFPKQYDEFNVVLWEAVALSLAKNAGIKELNWRVETILGKPVLLIKRFDRVNNTRVPFLSSMSMLDASDNEQHSYLEIAQALAQYGASPALDMEELWRRIIFTIMISNTDDHLRNHGFIYQRHKGWRLSPAYDLNPTPLQLKPKILTTAIDYDDTTASIDTALKVASEFRVSNKRADQIIKEVSNAVSQWRTVAKYIGLSKAECDYMSSAFNY
jgi:serine/threonine-protein kinase HipA